MKKIFLALFTCTLALNVGAQSNCNSAVDLGVVPADAVCPGSPDGSFTTPIAADITSVGGPSNPYTYIPDCNNAPGNNMSLFANDLWFSFTATSNILNVDLANIVDLDSVNVGFYTGTCASLIGLGCQNGVPDGSNAFSATLEPLSPGTTYFIQVSGATLDATGTFDISIANSLDCSDCLTGADFTVTPAPLAGTYQPGDVVDFCFTLTDYEQNSSNWFHGIELTYGAGWDASSLVPTSIPASCSGSGEWGLYPSITGTNGSFGQGFYYDYNGFPNGPGDGNPGNNFGDNLAADCDPQFCWQITVDNPICDPLNPPSLDMSVNTLADGEAGSWTSIACVDDALYTVNAFIACCNPPDTSSTAVSCPGVSDGSITATIPGAEPTLDGNYIFSFYDANGNFVYSTTVLGVAGNDVTATTPSTLAEGTYTVIVSNPVNCAASSLVTVLPPPGTPTAIVPLDIVVCNGDPISETFSTNPLQVPEWDFNWTMDTDVGAGLSGTASATLGFTAVNTGTTILFSTVTVIPDDGGGCPGLPATFNITVNPAPVITITAAPDAVMCPLETIDLQACYTPAPLGVSTQFFEGVDVEIVGSGSNPDVGTTSVTSTGILPATLEPGVLESICFTLSMAEPENIDWFSIEVNGVVYSSNVAEPVGSVYNADLNTLFNTIDAIPDNGNGNAPPVTQTFCVPQGFLDSLDVTGGSTNTTWTFFTDFSLGGGKDAFIWDFEVTLLSTTPYTYIWSPDAEITAGSTSGDSFGECHTVTVSPAADETYQFDLTDNAGCTGTQTIDITITAPPTATMVTSSSVYCEETSPSGVDIDVALTGTPNWTLEYAIDGVTQPAITGITTSPYTITDAVGTAAGAVYTIVSVGDQGCAGGTFSGTYTVTENPTPTISAPVEICAGGLANSATTLTGSGTPAADPAWTITGSAGGGAATLSNTGSNTVTVTGVSAGTVDIQYTDVNGCVESTTVTINPLPVPVADNTGDYCVGQTIELSAEPIALVSYNWTGPLTYTSSTEDPSILNSTTAMSGDYIVTVVDGNGCSDLATTTVVVLDLPVVTPVTDFSVCSGIAGNINVNLASDQDPDVTYAWTVANVGTDITGGADGSGNPITQTLTNGATTAQTIDYIVTGTNTVTGCGSSTMTFTVTVDPTPTITGLLPICAGGLSNTTVALTGSGTPAADPAWTITGSAGGGAATLTNTDLNTVTVTGTSAGTVDLEYTDANGCIATTTVVVNLVPVPLASNGGPYCVGDDIALALDLTGLTTGWTGPNSFSSAVEDPIIVNGQLINAGDYTVTVLDANGCSDSDITTVVINPLPTAIISGTNTICDGQSTDLTFTLTGTGDFDIVYTDGTSNFNENGIIDGFTVSVSPATTTTYTLVSVLDNGTNCVGTVSGSAVITVTPLPTAVISLAAGPICAGEDAVFTITGTPGATVTYSLDGGATNPTVIIDGAGNATITAATTSPTSPNMTLDLSLVLLGACSDVLTETETIIVNDLPTYTIGLTGNPTTCLIKMGL